MSVESAIRDLIRELKRTNGSNLGVGGGGSRRSGGSRGDDDDLSDKDRTAREKKTGDLIGKFAGGLGDEIRKKISGMFMAELESGLKLDQDIATLFDPLERQIRRLRDYKDETKNIFREFGQTTEDLSARFGKSREIMEDFGKESQRLYGNAEIGYKIYGMLTKEFGGFMGVTEDAQRKIGNTVMAMESMGFSTNSLSKVLDNSTRSLGKSGDEANNTILKLARLRKEFNVGAAEITQNYIMAQDKLIYNSARVDRVFADLQRTSRISGVEFSTLVQNFGEGFDTFEDSAKKAGGLNALLGGNVFNSLDLLEKDEGERMATIIDGIRGSVNVNALISDKFNLKAVANQLGLTPDQTRRLLLGETSVTEALEKAIPTGAKAVERSNKQMGDALDELRRTFVDARGPLAQAVLDLANSINTTFTSTDDGKGTAKFGVTAEGALAARAKLLALVTRKDTTNADAANRPTSAEIVARPVATTQADRNLNNVGGLAAALTALKAGELSGNQNEVLLAILTAITNNGAQAANDAKRIQKGLKPPKNNREL